MKYTNKALRSFCLDKYLETKCKGEESMFFLALYNEISRKKIAKEKINEIVKENRELKNRNSELEHFANSVKKELLKVVK